jgi:hypothetical protein
MGQIKISSNREVYSNKYVKKKKDLKKRFNVTLKETKIEDKISPCLEERNNKCWSTNEIETR